MKRLKKLISLDEINQIEEWTQMKIENIIFDSNIDDWKQGTSVFDQRILNINESNLIFVIIDTDGNKFGVYSSAVINEVGVHIDDPKAFIFSLKPNGRLNGMLKFDIKNSQKTFYLFNQSDYRLFAMEMGAIFVFSKKSIKMNHIANNFHLITKKFKMHFMGKQGFSHLKESLLFSQFNLKKCK